MKKSSSQAQAFTLIELLVVIAIIAILAAILFPVFAQAKVAAKKTADLSNTKQIGTSLVMYATDNDDLTPLLRIVQNGGDWWTARMTSWKDADAPYVKNGGRDYNNGTAYTTPGNGGIFQSPMADAPWSNVSPIYWGINSSFPGDETSRFPRGYSLNYAAGTNEMKKGGIFADWEVNSLQNGSPGSVTQLDQPANTALIINNRTSLIAASADYLGFQCSANGLPASPNSYSCIQSTKNKGLTMSYFDGHAKNVNVMQSVAQDMWDSITQNEAASPGYRQGLINNINAISEWTKS